MKILLSGATGFIGRHLLAYLIARGIGVCCVVRDANRIRLSGQSADAIEVIEGDLTVNDVYKSFPNSLNGVIHLAALLGEWNVSARKVMETNVVATKRLLEWYSASDANQFIFLSTPGVQGFGYKSAKESVSYNPRGIYEKSKVSAERAIRNHQLRPDQRWTILRPDFVYGPGDSRRIPLYKRVKNRRWISVGKGTSVLRPTYIRDVCDAVYRCVGNPSAYSQIFNVAGPNLIPVREYIDTIADIFGVKLLPIALPTFFVKLGASLSEWIANRTNTKPFLTKSQVDFLTLDHGTDISKIMNLIGFVPTVDLREGMRQTLDWARQQNLL
jgi:UDP-glucose 4-epimerase